MVCGSAGRSSGVMHKGSCIHDPEKLVPIRDSSPPVVPSPGRPWQQVSSVAHCSSCPCQQLPSVVASMLVDQRRSMSNGEFSEKLPGRRTSSQRVVHLYAQYLTYLGRASRSRRHRAWCWSLQYRSGELSPGISPTNGSHTVPASLQEQHGYTYARSVRSSVGTAW